ncbi:MAG: hypothetical protein COC24_005760 [Alphaproteobacteria bacterium]|nr:hypothetical protein [Alphaproteobacteria bacterium]
MFKDYLLIAAFLFIPALAFILHAWQYNIRPLFIPRAEIEKLATQLIEIHGDGAYDFVYMHEDRAWRYGETYERGKWKKVGKAIRNKQTHLYGRRA